MKLVNKFYLIIFFISILNFKLKSQNFEWLKTYGTKNLSEGINQLCVDSNKNCIIYFDGSGAISDTLKFNKINFQIPYGKKEDFMVRFDSSFKTSYAKPMGNVSVLGFCNDNFGNYFLSGTITKTSNILDTIQFELKKGRAFIAKLDYNFNLKWVTQFGSDTVCGVRNLKYFNKHLYFTGYSMDTTIIGKDTFYFGNQNSNFFGEINILNGNFLWSKYLYKNINFQDFNLTDLISLNKNIFLTGYVVSKGIKINTDTFYSGSGFIIKTDSFGNYIQRFLIRSNLTMIYCINTDGKNLYIGGSFNDTLIWDKRKFLPQYKSGTPFASELFIASVSKNLIHRWFFRPKIIEKTFNSYGNNFLCINYNLGFLYFGGYYNTKILIDSIVLPLPNSHNIILLKTDTIGNILWANHGNTNKGGLNNFTKINSSVLACGRFNHYIQLGNLTDTSKGGSDGFITKITDYSITRGKVSPGPYCAGDTILIPYSKF
ncbi:MAG: hypothetical protein HUU47_07680, partial [Bacteroidetes bacterium]|nr:hypothetical protein [Bacteroidota bacterium]